MNPVSGIVVYIIVWWIVFFCALPFGVPSEYEDQGKTVAPGAPLKTLLKKKLAITSLISLLIWGIIFAIVKSDLISFREMAKG